MCKEDRSNSSFVSYFGSLISTKQVPVAFKHGIADEDGNGSEAYHAEKRVFDDKVL